MRIGAALHFSEVVKDDTLPERMIQRMAMGETLKEIAESLGVPHTLLASWVARQGELNEQLARVRANMGHEYRMEGLEIIDGATPESLWVDKERATYRERLSKSFAPQTYGDRVKVDKTVTLDVEPELLRAASELLEHVREVRAPALPKAKEVGAVIDTDFEEI